MAYLVFVSGARSSRCLKVINKVNKRRRCCACGRMDHVVPPKCPSGRRAVGKRRDETTGTFGVTIGYMRVPISEAKGRCFCRSDKSQNHRTVRINVSGMEQILNIMKSPLSVGEEAVIFGLPKSLGTNFRH